MRRAIKVTIDGIVFDSRAEGRYYELLKERMASGELVAIECHRHFDLVVNNRKIGRGFKPDFIITYADGRQEAHETKGLVGRDFPLRRDLFRALYPTIPLIIIPTKTIPLP